MDVHIVADSFLDRHEHQLIAAGSIVVTLLVLFVVDRTLTRRGGPLARAVDGGRLSAVADTRLRFLRRLVDVTIVVIGGSIALSQFAALDRVASTLLTSSAIAAAVIGFAARQTLANAIAGLLLAITQPLRIGDLVTFEGETGTVEDVRLTYTWLRTAADARVIVPNERLAAGILRNDSIATPTVVVEISLWIGHADDETAAVAALRAALPDAQVRVVEITHEGTRLVVSGRTAPPSERAAAESELRVAALRALREAGLREDE
jgi:small-conductance mechanosensitive channel